MATRNGRAAQRNGNSFEAELEHDNAVYRRQKLAAVNRQHPPVVVGSNGQPLAWRKNGPPDFGGVLMGVPVLFDAKARAGARLFDVDFDDRHQVEDLAAHALAGGLAFILVRDDILGRLYLVGPDYFDRLLVGERVELRAFAKRGAVVDDAEREGTPMVPCLQVSEQDRLLRQVRGVPVWDWARLVALAFPDFKGRAWANVAR